MTKKSVSQLEDNQSLITLVSRICEKLGLVNITILNEYVISATEEGALGHRSYIIVCTLSELNGQVNLIKELIKENSNTGDDIIVVSSNKKKIARYFREWLQKELNTDKLSYWEEPNIVSLIDKHLPEYWGHNDVFLKTFEDSFLTSLGGNDDLQQALRLDKKFEELLNIFIEPKIYYLKEDESTSRIFRAKFKMEKFTNGGNFIISGDAGTGKSTLLKEIGKLCIVKNNDSIIKTLPIRLKTNLIANSNYSINEAINKEISTLIGGENVTKIFKDYRVLLLIDSIDEFETEKQKNIFNELTELFQNENLNFILASRNYEKLTRECEVCEHINTILSNFDLHQVKQYLGIFFKRDLKKSEDLWENLLDNKILDKIPPTPLTISLVSILYEENGYEIPATITDVYDNFNTFLLGRLNVNSNLDFLKISVKEKILQMYALSIIKTPNRIRKLTDEFIIYVIEYFKRQSITIEDGLIPELIKCMTDGTGVLLIDEQGYVTFQHDHFMEYYASREIFFEETRTELEGEIIERFTEFNWQNTAIFYTGRTKNMQNFLTKLIERVGRYRQLHDHLVAISGLGYVLQSLWMTNSEIRKKAVIVALDTLMKADSGVKQLAERNFDFFKGIRDIDIAMMNLAWFFLHYNSLTLRDPLQLAFDELHESLNEMGDTVFEKDKTTKLYQLFCLAATLNTGRVKDTTKLQILFDQDKILTEPLFVFLFDEAIEVLEYSNEAKLRKDYKIASKRKKYSEIIRFYLKNTAEELRFTTYEKLNPIKNVMLFTEGKTDASLISHAFRVLTMGEDSYWSITAIENMNGITAGGAQQLAVHLKFLDAQIESDFDRSKIIIGIFDNDSKGYQEFNGLPQTFKKVNGILKKVDGKNIYALMLPIPEDEHYKVYHQEKQVFKFFEIEHYFSPELLDEQKMKTETSIPGVFEITGSKSTFNEHILKLIKKDDFKGFIDLFLEIDKICNKEINYQQ